jgi:mannose-6-phosphate isomerase-like protein (cupin superfamily)
MAKIFEFKDAPHTTTAGRGTTYRFINEDMDAEKIGVMLIELEPMMKSPRIHYHKNRESAYIVLEGSATVTINGTEHQIKPKTVVFLSPGDKHGITSTGEKGFKMIEVYSPLDPDFIELPEKVQ